MDQICFTEKTVTYAGQPWNSESDVFGKKYVLVKDMSNCSENHSAGMQNHDYNLLATHNSKAGGKALLEGVLL